MALTTNQRVARAFALILLMLLGTPPVATRLREGDVPAPAGTRFALIQGDTVAYHTWGPADGTVVLMVHGAATWGHVWSPVAEALAANGWRVVAADLPPFGWSTRAPRMGFSASEQAARLEELLGIVSPEQPAVLVAHSIGAASALALAEAAPERVARLVWVSPALSMDEAAPTGGRGVMSRLLTIAPVREWLFGAVALWPDGARKALQANYGPATPAATAEDAALLSTPFARRGSVRGWSAWAMTALAPPATPLNDRRAAAEQLRQPMLLVWGDADAVTPIAQRRTLLQLWPQSDTVTYAGVGHFPPTEVKARLAADVAGWLGVVERDVRLEGSNSNVR